MKIWFLASLTVFSIYACLLYVEALFLGGSIRAVNISALSGLPLVIASFIIVFKFPRATQTPVVMAILIQLIFIGVGSYLKELEFYFLFTLLMVGCVSVMKDFKQLARCVFIMTVINIFAFFLLFHRLDWLDHFRFFMEFMLFLFGSIFLLLQTYSLQRREGISERAFASFSAMLRTTPNYMAITDSKFQVRYLSDAMAKFIQCPDKEFAIGQPFIDLVSDRGLKIMFADILDTEGYYETIVPLDIDGEEKFFKVISDKLEIGGQFVEISDITQMVKSQIATEEARNMAEQANVAKSKFLATMSHEIRTPMNAIIGITEIEMNKEEHSKDSLESLRRIHASGYTLLNIINDILDLSKIEAGKFKIVPAKYDIASLVNDTVQLNIMRLGSKEIEFALDISEDLPAYLIGDNLRIKQILNNLLSNAFKYTDKGRVTLSISAKSNASVESGELRIESDANLAAKEQTHNSQLLTLNSQLEQDVTLIFKVSDTGQGMDAKQVTELFSEYSRFNQESNRIIEGTGLGLSITKRLVELMQGNISVESKPGEGSVFTVQLLQQAADERQTIGKELAENLKSFNFLGEKQMAKTQIVREYMPYGKVLIVDDIETNLFVAKGLLRPYGLKVDVATSGFEALRKVRDGEAYDIIFMDHMMPQMDGIETAKKLREMGYVYPIVALTANAIVGQAEVFMQNGFDGFISKPIDIRQLNAALNKHVRDKQNPEVIEAARQQKTDTQKLTLPENSLRSVFARDAKKVLPVLENIFKNIETASEEDWHLFTVDVHAMKSALASIGEHELSKNAALLEAAGKERDKDKIKSEQNFFKAVKDIIDSEASKEVYASKDEDAVFLRERLQVIKEACAKYEDITAETVLKDLKKMKWTKETKELLDSISESLLFSDFDAIVSRISQTEENNHENI